MKHENKSATARAIAAQRSRDNVIEERTMLLAWLTRVLPASTSHLSPVKRTTVNALWNWVVCVHSKEGQMVWRITDVEAEAYFGHLARHDCEMGQPTREEKLARLSALISL